MKLKKKKVLISFIKLAYKAKSDRYWIEIYNDGDWSLHSFKRKEFSNRVFLNINLLQLAESGWLNLYLHLNILKNLWAIETLLDRKNK